MNISVTELNNPYFYMWAFICILQTAVTGWAFLRCFKITVPKPIMYLIFILGNEILLILSKFSPVNLNMLTPICGILVPVLLTVFFTVGSKVKVVIFHIICQMLDWIVEFIVHITIRLLDMPIDLIAFNSEKVMITILFLFLITPAKYIMANIWNVVVNKSSGIRISWMFVVFPVAQALANMAMIIQNVYWDQHSFSSFYYIFAAMLIFALSDIFLLYFISDFEKKKSLEQELKTIEYTRLLEEKHYKMIEEKRYETAKIRHDIKNHLIAMQNLISLGKINDTKALIDELEKNIDGTKEYEYCGVPIVNAIIGEKFNLCEMNSISLNADICLDDPDGIAKSHLCCIFSNLLDNAIKETAKLEEISERNIEIKAAQKHSIILISCKNPVPSGAENRKLDPQKSSGYGLKILHDIAMQYDGSFDIEIADGICTAVIAVVTNISDTKET